MRRHGSSQSQTSNISLLDEIAESFHTGVINQGTVSSLPLPVPEHDAESALDDERLLLFQDNFIYWNWNYKFSNASIAIFYMMSLHF